MDPQELMVDLAACIEVTFAEEGRPPVCFNGIVPGEGITPAWGIECETGPCGMTWVRLVTAYPSVTIGVQDQSTNNCGHGLGIDLEVGVLRCTPVGLEGAEQEEVDALQTSADITGDMLALRKAIICCTSLPNKDSILGGWSPIGPSGGVVGGAWGVYAGLLD